MASDFFEVMTFAEHAIEFVDEQRNRLVTFVRLDDGVHIGTVDGNMTLGLESGGDGFLTVELQFYADPHDAVLVTKQSIGFLLHKHLKGWGEVEVDAGDDQFVVVLSVHDAALCLGFSAARADHPPWPKF
jgi:hypothetical protein